MKICDNCKRETKPEDFDEDMNLCNECSDYLQDLMREEENYVQVTKDMASDAGDKSLEGQWIKW